MKRFFIIIYIFISIITIQLTAKYSINKIFILKYNNEIYNEKDIKALFLLNFFESYIAHYNNGNIMYKKDNFDEAITEYNRALELHPTRKKEYDIRINLALAMLKKIDSTDISEANKEKMLEILKESKEVLSQNGCSDEKNQKGYSLEAKKLKEDIEKKEKEIEEQFEEDKDSEEKEDSESSDEKNKKEKGIEEKLQEIRNKGIEERNGDLQDSILIYEYEYYDGKQW